MTVNIEYEAGKKLEIDYDSIIRQVVALVPSAGPVPPPIIVVMPL